MGIAPDERFLILWYRQLSSEDKATIGEFLRSHDWQDLLTLSRGAVSEYPHRLLEIARTIRFQQ
jgi:hypothetical protein